VPSVAHPKPKTEPHSAGGPSSTLDTPRSSLSWLVPRNRLLFWVAVLGLPLALLSVAEPAATVLSLGVLVLFAVFAAADALGALAHLRGLSLQLPSVSRMSKDRLAKIEIRIRNVRLKAQTLRVALALPREIQTAQEDTLVRLPADSEWSRFTWDCTPRMRGQYRLRSAALEATSPLGLWAARRTVPASSEIRVYPNLLSERKDLAALFLHRGSFGLHAQRQLGKGREFEKLREYIPGDSFEDIHWKATARRGHPITKTFQIERTQEVYVVLDASRLSARSVAGPVPGVVGNPGANDSYPSTLDTPPPSPALERFIAAALVLGLAAEQQGDLFGLLTFTNRVDRFVRAKNGKAHYSACRDALYLLQPQVVTPDFDELCTFIRLRLRRRALLFFLTALDDPVLAESFVRNLDLIRRQHLVMVNMVQPPGVAPIFSSPNVGSVDDLYQHLGGHLLWQNLRELEKVLQRRGVGFSLLKNERLSAQLVAQYLNVKRRQAL
jgi:uncharacterized protein (DUF58 family)